MEAILHKKNKNYKKEVNLTPELSEFSIGASNTIGVQSKI